MGVESIKPVLPEIYAVFVHSHHGTDIYFQLFLVWKNIVFFFSSSDIFPDSVPSCFGETTSRMVCKVMMRRSYLCSLTT